MQYRYKEDGISPAFTYMKIDRLVTPQSTIARAMRRITGVMTEAGFDLVDLCPPSNKESFGMHVSHS